MNTITASSQPNRRTVKLAPILVIAAVIAVFIALNIIAGGRLLTFQNLMIVLTAATVPAFVGWGFSFIFACNITDLSAGAIVILAATVAGISGNAFGYPVMIVCGSLVGVLCLALNMTIYRVSKIPPWIAGLGMTMIYETIVGYYSQLRVAQGLRVEGLTDEMRALGRSPLIYVALLIGLGVAYIIYNKTPIGLNARAVGGNEEVARMMGINPQRALLLGGLVAGLFFGMAGVLRESYAGYVVAQTGLSSLSTVFQPLAAVLLAQAIQKWVNIVVAIPISTFFIALIFNVLTLLGVPSGTFQEFCLGLLVITFGIIAQHGVKEVVK